MKKTIIAFITVTFAAMVSNCSINNSTNSSAGSCNVTSLGVCYEFIGSSYTYSSTTSTCTSYSGTSSTSSCSTANCVGNCIYKAGTSFEGYTFYYSPTFNSSSAASDCATAGVNFTFSSTCP